MVPEFTQFLTIDPPKIKTFSTSFWVKKMVQEMKATKKTKSLAVSNFSPEQLDCILADPAASAIMMSWLNQAPTSGLKSGKETLEFGQLVFTGVLYMSRILCRILSMNW